MRFRPGPQGRAMPYKKLTSHLTVKVREVAPAAPPKARASGRKQRQKGQG